MISKEAYERKIYDLEEQLREDRRTYESKLREIRNEISRIESSDGHRAETCLALVSKALDRYGLGGDSFFCQTDLARANRLLKRIHMAIRGEEYT